MAAAPPSAAPAWESRCFHAYSPSSASQEINANQSGPTGNGRAGPARAEADLRAQINADLQRRLVPSRPRRAQPPHFLGVSSSPCRAPRRGKSRLQGRGVGSISPWLRLAAAVEAWKRFPKPVPLLPARQLLRGRMVRAASHGSAGSARVLAPFPGTRHPPGPEPSCPAQPHLPSASVVWGHSRRGCLREGCVSAAFASKVSCRE